MYRKIGNGRWKAELFVKSATVLLVFCASLLTGCGSPEYEISTSAQPSDGGVVTPPGGVWEEGEEVEFEATPAEGYRFDHWSGGATGKSPAVTVVVESTGQVVAHFQQVHDMSASVRPEGSGTVRPASGTYDDGETVELVAEPSEGFQFDGWSGGVDGGTPHITLVMHEDVQAIANFERTRELAGSVAPLGGGTIVLSPPVSVYGDGDTVELRGEPLPGYCFDRWSGDIAGTDAMASIAMDDNKDVTAHFRVIYSPTYERLCDGVPMPWGEPSDTQGYGVVLTDWEGGRHEWSDDLPMEWLPETVGETRVVVRVGSEEEHVIQTCEYNGPDITRYDYRLDIELIETTTGKAIADDVLRGEAPRKCKGEEPWSLTRLDGSHVTFDQVMEWLRQELPEPSATKVDNPVPMYVDDFSHAMSGFGTMRTDDCERYYEDGRYHVKVKKPDWAAWAWGSQEEFDNFRLETVARRGHGASYCSYGLVFRLRGSDFYRFLLNPSGSFTVDKHSDAGWSALQAWQDSPYINRGDAANRLEVVCTGSTTDVYANGHYLTTVTDDSYPAGCVGLIVCAEEPVAHAAFERIAVYGLP
jgi:hypothetical protein